MIWSIIANILGWIKYTKLYEYNENDVVMSGFTDNISRIKDYNFEYAIEKTLAVYAIYLIGLNINHCM